MCMEHAWNVQDICEECVWYMREHAWDMHLVCMEKAENMYGTCIECAWNTYGIEAPSAHAVHPCFPGKG